MIRLAVVVRCVLGAVLRALQHGDRASRSRWPAQARRSALQIAPVGLKIVGEDVRRTRRGRTSSAPGPAASTASVASCRARIASLRAAMASSSSSQHSSPVPWSAPPKSNCLLAALKACCPSAAATASGERERRRTTAASRALRRAAEEPCRCVRRSRRGSIVEPWAGWGCAAAPAASAAGGASSASEAAQSGALPVQYGLHVMGRWARKPNKMQTPQ